MQNLDNYTDDPVVFELVNNAFALKIKGFFYKTIKEIADYFNN